VSIPPDFIERIKAEVSIKEWIGKTVKLKRNGKEYVGLCCFHAEKTPSFTVYDNKFKCFGCGESGDVIDFVQRTRGIEWLDAVAILAQDAGMTLPNGYAGHVPADSTEIIQTPENPDDNWAPQSPPDGVPSPEMRGFDKIYVYRDAAGNVIRYVGRKEATHQRAKTFTPFTWGFLNGLGGWYAKHPKIRSLYNLDLLAQRPDAPVLIVEGEKAADAANAKFPHYVALTWSAGSSTSAIKATDWSPLSHRDVVIWPDNDAPGHKAATEIAEILSDIAKTISLVKVDDLPPKADAADAPDDLPDNWISSRITPYRPAKSQEIGMDDVPFAPPNPQTPKNTLPVVSFLEIEAKLDVSDFVEGVLVENALSVVFGQSNAGKTFWTSDLAFHVAAGKRWNNRDVKQGTVLYLALEGTLGIHNRVAAFKEAHGLDDANLPFLLATVSLDLLRSNGDTDAIIATAKEAGSRFEMPVILIVIDTVMRAMAGGNENSSEDMGAFLKNLDAIRVGTGAHVLGVHHSGKDEAKGARGWSGLRGAVDTEIEIRSEGAVKTAEIQKQRDLPKGDVFGFTLEVVKLGANQRGSDVTSCVVRSQSTDDLQKFDRKKSLKGHTKRALEVLIDLMGDAKPGFGAPIGITSIPEKWWRERFYDTSMPGAEDKAKQAAFRRASDALLERHFIAVRAGRVWTVEAPKQEIGGYSDEPD
jgi:AAA domain/CHC2 zinc finger/Domain of unknown function (DUF6371)